MASASQQRSSGTRGFPARRKQVVSKDVWIKYTSALKEARKSKKSKTKDLSPDRVVEDLTNLIDDDDVDFYHEFINGPFIIERYVISTDFEDMGLDAFCNSLRISQLMGKDMLYFPKLVAQFYSNLSWEENKYKVRSKVQGISFVLTPESIRNILSIPRHGLSPEDETISSLGWNSEEVMKTLCGEKWQEGVRKVSRDQSLFPLSLLTPKFKLLAKIFQSNIVPQSGHLQLIGMTSILTLYACEKSIPVDISEMILRNFCEAREKLVMPCFLTLVFKHFGISVEGFESKKGSRDISLSILKRMSSRKEKIPEKKRPRVTMVDSSDDSQTNTEQHSSLRHLEVQVKKMHKSLKKLKSQVKGNFRDIKATLKALCTACGVSTPPSSPHHSGKGKNVVTGSDSDFSPEETPSDSD